MPKSKKSSNWWSLSNFDLQESYPSLILGAIIVIIFGLLVANFFARNKGEEIGEGEQVEQVQESSEPVAGSEYVVVENDSLAKISEAAYGSQDLWIDLARINNIANPNILFVGTKLSIPPAEELEAPAEIQEAQAAPGFYEVKQGDTLFKIAELVYGDGSRWSEISRANNLGRLPNGNPLVLWGTTIRIP